MSSMNLLSERRLSHGVLEALRDSPRGMTAAQLATHLRVDIDNARRALHWLRKIHAPVVTETHGSDRPRVLTDLEWRIPFESLDAQCKIFELERAIKPGNATNLLECILRVQRENFALRRRLIQKEA